MAERALEAIALTVSRLVTPGSLVALGTGATVTACLPLLAEIPGVAATPTSSVIEASAREVGIKIAELSSSYDIYIDGVDQVTAAGHSIKGSWGAHVREKTLARLSKQRILIGTESKLVDKLTGPVPVAVLAAFAGLYPANGEQAVDENGLALIPMDAGSTIDDPTAWANRVEALPAVVCCGVFPADFVDMIIIGTDAGQVDYITTKRGTAR